MRGARQAGDDNDAQRDIDQSREQHPEPCLRDDVLVVKRHEDLGEAGGQHVGGEHDGQRQHRGNRIDQQHDAGDQIERGGQQIPPEAGRLRAGLEVRDQAEDAAGDQQPADHDAGRKRGHSRKHNRSETQNDQHHAVDFEPDPEFLQRLGINQTNGSRHRRLLFNNAAEHYQHSRVATPAIKLGSDDFSSVPAARRCDLLQFPVGCLRKCAFAERIHEP